jgi:hypothetical protein
VPLVSPSFALVKTQRVSDVWLIHRMMMNLMVVVVVVMMMIMGHLSARRSRATMAGAWTVLIRHD